MTPVQAAGSAADHLPRRGRRPDGRTTLWDLALRTTFGQNRWRTLLSAVSLLAAAALLNGIWMQYASFREDLYLSVMCPWDYSFMDGSAYLNVQQYNEKNRGITEETVAELKARPEVTDVSVLKSHETELTASDTLRRRIVDYYNQPYDETMTLKETQAGYPHWGAGLDRLEQSGEYMGLVIGMDGAYLEYVLENRFRQINRDKHVGSQLLRIYELQISRAYIPYPATTDHNPCLVSPLMLLPK